MTQKEGLNTEYIRSVGLEKRPRTSPGNTSNNPSSGTARVIRLTSSTLPVFSLCCSSFSSRWLMKFILVTLFSISTPQAGLLQDCPDICEDRHNAIQFEPL